MATGYAVDGTGELLRGGPALTQPDKRIQDVGEELLGNLKECQKLLDVLQNIQQPALEADKSVVAPGLINLVIDSNISAGLLRQRLAKLCEEIGYL